MKLIGEQIPTEDGTQVRDLVFRNLRTPGFCDRAFHKLGADLITFDAKNYTEEIEKDEFVTIAQYANPATGKLAILVSRKGESEAARKTQSRQYRTEGKVVLSIKDADLLEMVERKENGENPADFLDDLLDRLSISF